MYLVVLITFCSVGPFRVALEPDQSMADAEEQQQSARIRKTSWARDAKIRDYRGGAVPDALRGHFYVLSGVLAPEEERITTRLGPHFTTGTVTPGFE